MRGGMAPLIHTSSWNVRNNMLAGRRRAEPLKCAGSNAQCGQVSDLLQAEMRHAERREQTVGEGEVQYYFYYYRYECLLSQAFSPRYFS